MRREPRPTTFFVEAFRVESLDPDTVTVEARVTVPDDATGAVSGVVEDLVPRRPRKKARR